MQTNKKNEIFGRPKVFGSTEHFVYLHSRQLYPERFQQETWAYTKSEYTETCLMRPTTGPKIMIVLCNLIRFTIRTQLHHNTSVKFTSR